MAFSTLGLGACGGTSTAPTEAAPSNVTATNTSDFTALIEAENAAIYAYGVIGAHLHGADRAEAMDIMTKHRRLRDTWIAAATSTGQGIPAAAIAYDLPYEVRNAASARRLAREIDMRMADVYEAAGEIASDALAKTGERSDNGS